MPKKQTAAANVTETDPLGELMTAKFVTKSFKKAVKEAWEQNRQQGLDSFCAIDGKVVAVKPDGRVEPAVFNQKNHG